MIFDPGTASTDEDLIVAADIALHEAKERGGDRYEIFTGAGSERLAWVGHVREAIDNERLRLHAQPIFDLRNGEQIGCGDAGADGRARRLDAARRPRSCPPPSASA